MTVARWAGSGGLPASFEEQFAALEGPAAQLDWLTANRFLGVLDLLQARGLLSTQAVALARPIAERRGMVPLAQMVEEKRVVAALVERSIRVLVLKGCLLGYRAYPSPEQRWRADLDVLVDPGQVVDAGQVLAELGYRPLTVTPGGTPIDQSSWTIVRGRVRCVVDVHWSLRKHPILRERFSFERQWQSSVELDALASGARGHDHVHALINAATHWYDSLYGEPRPLGWLLDVDLLWRGMSDPVRQRLAGCACEHEVAGVVAEQLAFARAVFDTPVPHGLIERLTIAGIDQPATRMTEVVDRPLIAWWLAVVSEPSWSAGLGRVWKSLLPPPDHLRQRFPGGSRLGLPGLYLRRILTRLRKINRSRR